MAKTQPTAGSMNVIVEEYGNGVFGVTCYRSYDFPKWLSKFIEENPELRVVSMTTFGDRGHVLLTEAR